MAPCFHQSASNRVQVRVGLKHFKADAGRFEALLSRCCTRVLHLVLGYGTLAHASKKGPRVWGFGTCWLKRSYLGRIGGPKLETPGPIAKGTPKGKTPPLCIGVLSTLCQFCPWGLGFLRIRLAGVTRRGVGGGPPPLNKGSNTHD